MRIEKFGKLRVHLAGGLDREGGGDGPLIVLLHGFGAPGTDLVGLWRQLSVPQTVRFAFAEAPLTPDVGIPDYPGRAWWIIDMIELEAAIRRGDMDGLAREVPTGLDAARAALSETLDELEDRLNVPSGKLILGGFSQGAMLSCDLALRSERALGGLVLMSGMMLCEEQWRPLMPRRRGLPVLMSHGRADPLLPYELAERLRDALSAAGLPVEFIAFNGGHGIADSVLDALGRFIQRASGD
jgi:phospholipase/carboxylesterase